MSQVGIKRAAAAYVNFEKKGGTIVKLTAAQRQKWADTMPNVAQDWAKGLEEKGIPAKAVLSTYMDIMRDNKQGILRQWDQ